MNKHSAIYHNDNLIIDDESVKGTVEDLMEYFRYEIASQSMSFIDYENYIDNVNNMLDVINTFQEDLENEIFTKDDIFIVKVHPMGGFVIERE